MNRYLLTPETDYEQRGVIPNSVFATGDTFLNLATGNLDEIIDGCRKGI